MCVNGCSGRGQCIRGFCHCEPPYYGTGCLKSGAGARSEQHSEQEQHQQRLPARSRLRIYMYDLPWEVAFQDGYHPGECGSILAYAARASRGTLVGLGEGQGHVAVHQLMFMHEQHDHR